MLKAFQEFLKKILRVFQEYFEGCLKQAQKECVKLVIEVYGIFEGVSKNFRGVLGKFHGCHRDISTVFQGSFIEVSRIFHRSFKDLSKKFQGSFVEFSKIFHKSLKEVSRKG